MKIRLIVILGVLVFFASIGVTVVGASLVYGEERGPDTTGIRLTIELDKDSYKTGDVISMVGNLGEKESEFPAIVTLVRPDGKIVTSISMKPIGDIVAYNFTAGTGNMDVSGTYSFELSHNDQSIFNQFLFTNLDTIQVKTVGDDAPFFGIFVYVDNLFSWITGK